MAFCIQKTSDYNVYTLNTTKMSVLVLNVIKMSKPETADSDCTKISWITSVNDIVHMVLITPVLMGTQSELF